MELSEIMKNGRTALTFEIFPPKRDMPIETIYKTLDGMQCSDCVHGKDGRTCATG